MVKIKNFLGEHILSRGDPAEVVNSKEAGQLERNVPLLAGAGLRRDRLELPIVELLSALLVVHFEAFELVTRHGLDVVVLVLLDVLLQCLQCLARREQIANRRINGKVGRRDAENFVAQFHTGEGVVHEQVAAHELVHEVFADKSSRRVFCEDFLSGQFMITVPHGVAMAGFGCFLAFGGVRIGCGRYALFKCMFVSQFALVEPRCRRHGGLEAIDGAR